MSTKEHKDMSTKESKDLAFEYVLGTLRGEEREAFKQQLLSDDELAQEVQFWESSLQPAAEDITPVPPNKATLAKIQHQINHRQRTPEERLTFWQRLLPWKIATATAFSLLIVVSGFLGSLLTNTGTPIPTPNTEYVAVLTNQQDQPILTALTANDGSTLWLEWADWQDTEDHSLQLWSQSRSDGQIRPLMVFEGSQLNEIQLDQATWRLIKDSSHLIITREELGGSAIDEPSDFIVAKGVCIRLTGAKT